MPEKSCIIWKIKQFQASHSPALWLSFCLRAVLLSTCSAPGPVRRCAVACCSPSYAIAHSQGQKEFMMHASFGLPSISSDDHNLSNKAPISVKFEIPYFTVSGALVDSCCYLV